MFTTFVIQPIYNLFVALIGVMPHGDVGLAIIVLTIGIRLVLYPVFAASTQSAATPPVRASGMPE